MEEKEKEALVVIRESSIGIKILSNIINVISWLFIISGAIVTLYGFIDYIDICLIIGIAFMLVGILNLVIIPKLLNSLHTIVRCAENINALIERDNHIFNRSKNE